MTTANTIVADALGMIGVCDPTDAVAAEDASLGLRTLNRLCDALGADSLMPIATTFQAISLTAGDGSVTIGAAGEVAVTRPTRIEPGAYVDYGTLDRPLRKITRAEWGAISDKASTGVPQYYWYEPTTAVLGVIKFWPAPDVACTAYVPLQTRISQFADLTTSYSLPDGYEEYFCCALSVFVAPHYNREAPGSVIARMRAAKKMIKRLHVQVPTLSTPELCALSHGNYGSSVQAIVGDEIDIY